MPIVQIHILKGRTLEQKRTLAKKVTAAICESVNVSSDTVRIIISEMEPEHYAKSGALVIDEK